ncbi:MAG: hypothetical protein AAGF60_07575 [Pseudomonadota bacterium]
MPDLLSQIALVLPLLTLAGSAAGFVWKQYLDSREQKKRELFELMSLLDEKGTLASKLAAVYRLRDFPHHRDFVIRFCESVAQKNVDGSANAALQQELQATAQFMRNT